MNELHKPEVSDEVRKLMIESINSEKIYPLSHMDDVGDGINTRFKQSRFGRELIKCHANSVNNNLICESSLSRLLSFSKTDDWAIITAHRKKFNRRENIVRNRVLRGKLNDLGMGVHQLVGHWRECSVGGVSYDQCPADKLVDTIERSYFVVRPEEMDEQEFLDSMLDLMTIENETQDAIIYHSVEYDEIRVVGKNGEVYDTYHHTTLGKLAQAYSQHIKKLKVPFIFEGVEIPGSIGARYVMKSLNIKY